VKVALVTARSVPDWEVDDGLLHNALLRRGHTLQMPCWDDVRVDWSGFDAVLIRTPWDYTARWQAFVAWASRVDAATRLFNPAPILAWNAHKSYLRDLEAQGVPVVPTIWLDRGDDVDVRALCADVGWSRAFIKPAVGLSAEGTLRFDVGTAGEAASRHVDAWLPRSELLVQPYLSSVEVVGERSMIVFGGERSHAVVKVPVPGDYRVQDDFGASDHAYEPTAPELQLVDAAMAALRALGHDALYARVDWLLDDSGRPCLNELELIEPSLFFRHGGRRAAQRLVAALEARCG
jgi:hypothetical protein